VGEPPLGRAARRAVVALVGVLAVVFAGCGSSGAAAPSSRPGELVNTSLGPDYASWLVGPVARMATPEEIETYSQLTSDFAAADFIESFWSRRDPDPVQPGNPVRLEFERRAAAADRMYGEAAVLGRRTARGTIYVLYGKPAKDSFELAPRTGASIEVWTYAKDSPPGLDGKRPDRFYWFQEKDGITSFYQPRAPQPGARVVVPPPG